MNIIDRIIEANGICKAMTPPNLRHMLTASGHSVKLGQKYFIFLDPDHSPAGSEFTVAHELGHILLGHLDDPEVAGGMKEAELEANIFASVLMAFSLITMMEGAVSGRM